jgi:phosphatidylglycerol:prolipoprotein diacylglycerol transferase
MLPFPDIDPVAFRIGPIAVRWYGLSYVAGMGAMWWLLHRRAERGLHDWTSTQVADLVFFGSIGGVVGGRIGSMLFYHLTDFLANPLSLFAVWQGGMSFHGGVLGFIAATWWYARRLQRPFLAVTDFAVPVVPVAAFLVRIANFINGELWGKPTDLPWGVVFPGQDVPRHPSQLYEALLEGAVMFVILWPLSRRPRALGLLSALFLILYGSFRIAIEFVREPDQHIGYLAWGWLTEGQVLSLPMVIIGVVILLVFTRKHPGGSGAPT